MPNVAVVLSGCGYLDGSEIQEAVFTLYFLDLGGAEVQCFAPDKAQMHVVDHLKGEPTTEQRNVLTEAARIARGKIRPLAELDMANFDAVVMPGGFGAAKNLSDFALVGADASVEPDLVKVLQAAYEANKPIGAVCIAPAVLAAALKSFGASATLTIGDDAATAAALEACGSTHHNCTVESAIYDEAHKIASAPAYMFDASPKGVAAGIQKTVDKVLAWCN